VRRASVLTVLLIFASTAAAAPTRECLLELRLGAAPPPEGGLVRCQDGDPTCDTDGAVDGACTRSRALSRCGGLGPSSHAHAAGRSRALVSRALVYRSPGRSVPRPCRCVPLGRRAAYGGRRHGERRRRARSRPAHALCTAVPGSRPGGRAPSIRTDFETGGSRPSGRTTHSVSPVAEPVHSVPWCVSAASSSERSSRTTSVLDPARGPQAGPVLDGTGLHPASSH
jgi:hypothetical protein